MLLKRIDNTPVFVRASEIICLFEDETEDKGVVRLRILLHHGADISFLTTPEEVERAKNFLVSFLFKQYRKDS